MQLYIKKFYTQIMIIAIFYRTWSKLDQERADVCKQEIIPVESYTSLHHNNTQIILSLYKQHFIHIYIYI